MFQYKILLVDDSPSVLKALKRVFVYENYKVFCCLSADEALEVLSKENIDVLITDENMSGMSGTQLLVKAREMYPDTVRIMLTGMNDIEVAKKAINNGEIYKFFNKPWDDFELVVSVKYAIRQKYLEQENKKLKQKIQNQNQMLEKLEKEFPGIASKKVDADGAIIID